MREESRPIYLDHHATTPLDPRVREAMLPWLGARFGNPSSRSHVYGREASEAVESARADVARLIGAKSREIVFTSGATEADHLAITGVLRAADGARHVITQATEHSAVLRSLEDMPGIETEILPVDREGVVHAEDVARALRPSTKLVSIMLASSEIGTVQPIAAIARRVRSQGAAMHCDAAQGVGLLPLDVRETPVDLVSLSAHKMYGPMGVGALYVRDRHDLDLVPVVRGGGQERGLRGGTLNVAGIVGFGRAAALLREEGERDAARLAALRDRLRAGLVERVADVHFHGSFAARHPGNLSVRFDGVRAERLIVETSRAISFSSGAACASSSDAPSHVLRAIGLSDEEARSGVRLGLGRFTTEAEVDETLEVLVAAVRKIREVTAYGRGKEV